MLNESLSTLTRYQEIDSQTYIRIWKSLCLFSFCNQKKKNFSNMVFHVDKHRTHTQKKNQHAHKKFVTADFVHLHVRHLFLIFAKQQSASKSNYAAAQEILYACKLTNRKPCKVCLSSKSDYRVFQVYNNHYNLVRKHFPVSVRPRWK